MTGHNGSYEIGLDLPVYLAVSRGQLCLWAACITRLSGIYSDLEYNTETGDLNGMELLIVPQDSGSRSGVEWSAFVQISEGGAPYIAIVPLMVKGNRIEFTLPPGGAYSGMHLVGTITGIGILMRWSNGQIDRLRHGKSYWQ